jgi:hypothetical protein
MVLCSSCETLSLKFKTKLARPQVNCIILDGMSLVTPQISNGRTLSLKGLSNEIDETKFGQKFTELAKLRDADVFFNFQGGFDDFIMQKVY